MVRDDEERQGRVLRDRRRRFIRRAMGGSSPTTDPFFANVVLLAGFNGAQGAQTYTAETGQVMTFSGSSILDSAQKKYGTTAHKVVAGSISTFPVSPNWTLAVADADPFTIEWYQFLPGLANTVTSLHVGWNITGWMIRSDTTTFQWFWMDQGGVSRSITKALAGFTANQWDECCICKDSSRVLRMLINGVMVHSAVMPVGQGGILDTTSAGGWPLRIGMDAGNGVLDEVRITKGVSRYNDAGYTAHTTPFPRS